MVRAQHPKNGHNFKKPSFLQFRTTANILQHVKKTDCFEAFFGVDHYQKDLFEHENIGIETCENNMQKKLHRLKGVISDELEERLWWCMNGSKNWFPLSISRKIP